MKLTVHQFVTLDGVVQSPGAPGEDTSGGFGLGGWVAPFSDDDFREIVDSWFAKAAAFALGRGTYQIFQPYWSLVTDPDHTVAGPLNALPKYVASRTLTGVEWAGAELLQVDAVERLAQLRAQPGGELQVHGSRGLAAGLRDADLVDEYRLIVIPVVLGSGKRLFAEGGAPGGFDVVTSRTTPSGAVYLELRPSDLELRSVELAPGTEELFGRG